MSNGSQRTVCDFTSLSQTYFGNLSLTRQRRVFQFAAPAFSSIVETPNIPHGIVQLALA